MIQPQDIKMISCQLFIIQRTNSSTPVVTMVPLLPGISKLDIENIVYTRMILLIHLVVQRIISKMVNQWINY